MTAIPNDPNKPSLWGQSEAWRLQTAMRAVRRAVRDAHDLCAQSECLHLYGELKRLQTVERTLIAQAKELESYRHPDLQAVRSLASRLADYYRDVGVTELALTAHLPHTDNFVNSQ
jgi:hypothetical protein